MVIFYEVPSEGSDIAHFQPLEIPVEPDDPHSKGEAPGPTVERKKRGRISRKCCARMVSKENTSRCSRSRRLLLATAYTARALRQAEGKWMASRADDELPQLPALAARLRQQG